MFYIEDALSEQNIFTATRKKSFYSLAKVSGYEPFYGSSATGTVICTLIRGTILDKSMTKIFIPNHSKIKNKEYATKKEKEKLPVFPKIPAVSAIYWEISQ